MRKSYGLQSFASVAEVNAAFPLTKVTGEAIGKTSVTSAFDGKKEYWKAVDAELGKQYVGIADSRLRREYMAASSE